MAVERKNKVNDTPRWALSYFVAISFVFLLVLVAYLLLKSFSTALPNYVVWIEVGLLIAIVFLMVVAMIRKNFSIMWWEVVLLVAAMAGVWIYCLAVLPVWLGIILAVSLTLLPYIWQRTFLNSLTLLVGCAGIGLLVAFQFPYIVMLVCVIAVAVYDFLRRQDFKMAGLFSDAWKIGLAPGILIPAKTLDWFQLINKTWSAGNGQVVSLLPFMTLAAVVVFLLVWSYIYFLLLWFVLGLVMIIIGQSKDGYLRSWVFLAVSAMLFVIIGMYVKFL